MLRVLVLLALAGGCLPASQSRTLTLFLNSPASETMQSELARVVSPLGVQVNWRKLSERKLGEDFEQIVVVNIRGACDASAAPPAQPGERRLASAAVSNGSVLPFASIDCDNLKLTIADALKGQRSEVKEQYLGRAMARVLAHELYHILGATKEHHDKGLSKACFGSKDLLSDDFSLDEVSLAQMRPEEPAYDLADSSGR